MKKQQKRRQIACAYSDNGVNYEKTPIRALKHIPVVPSSVAISASAAVFATLSAYAGELTAYKQSRSCQSSTNWSSFSALQEKARVSSILFSMVYDYAT